MQPASSLLSDSNLASAAMPQLAGNSRQGFGLVVSTSCRASGWVISSSTLGFKGSLYDGDAGSRSPGKERDTESGNDYFEARYYSSAQEEPVPYAKLSDPQSLNLYAYVHNNPLSMIDPDGHGWWSDYWQKVGNNFKYGEFVINAQLPAAFASERSWLIQNAAANQSAITALQGASNQQVNQLFSGYRSQISTALGEASPLSADPRNYSLVAGALLYPGGDFSNVRGGADPAARGPSLFDNPAKIPPRFNVVNPVTEEMLGPNLQAVPRGQQGHFEVVPRESGVPPQTFLEWLGKILSRAEPIE